jgi:hypothetical protein
MRKPPRNLATAASHLAVVVRSSGVVEAKHARALAAGIDSMQTRRRRGIYAAAPMHVLRGWFVAAPPAAPPLGTASA